MLNLSQKSWLRPNETNLRSVMAENESANAFFHVHSYLKEPPLPWEVVLCQGTGVLSAPFYSQVAALTGEPLLGGWTRRLVGSFAEWALACGREPWWVMDTKVRWCPSACETCWRGPWWLCDEGEPCLILHCFPHLVARQTVTETACSWDPDHPPDEPTQETLKHFSGILYLSRT